MVKKIDELNPEDAKTDSQLSLDLYSDDYNSKSSRSKQNHRNVTWFKGKSSH